MSDPNKAIIRFEDNGRVCVIPYGSHPGQCKHFLTNPQYSVMVGDSGAGYSMSPASEGRFINYYDFRDPEKTGRFVYVKNETTGTLWNICRIPGTECHTSETRFGPGWYRLDAGCEGIEASLRVTVPEEPLSVEIWEIRLANRSGKPQQLSFYPFIEFFLGGGLSQWDEPEWYTNACYLPEENLIDVTLYLPNNASDNTVGAFMAPLYEIDGACVTRREFLGQGGLVAPDGIEEGCFSKNAFGKGERIVGVLKRTVSLDDGETESFSLLVGRADSREHRQAILRAVKEHTCAKTSNRVTDYWNTVFSHNTIETPDEDLNRWANVWLKYQIVQCVRTGGGVSANSPLLGYRDMLQHAAGIALIEPASSRNVILEALCYQYANGRAMRQWSRKGNHDTRDYRDSPYWIIPAVTAYLKETGDSDFLDQEVPYFDEGNGTVLDHLQNAINALFEDRGCHGLSHIGGGDWFDPLSACGTEGRGESVWLTMALVHALNEAADLYAFLGMNAREDICRQRIEELKGNIETYGWDGFWYRRLYDDTGRSIGGYDDDRIFLNPQVWAILSGCAPEDRLPDLFTMVDERLRTDFGYHIFMPPFAKFDPHIGNASILQRHSVYSHVNAFKIHADCMRSDGDSAYRTFKMICPDNPKNFYTHSGADPHIIPNGYKGFSHPDAGHVTLSGFSGTFSWLLRGALERICGARADYDGLILNPCIPKAWGGCRVSRMYRGSTYTIQIEDPDHLGSGRCQLLVDGQPIDGTKIPLPTRSSHHEVVCVIREEP